MLWHAEIADDNDISKGNIAARTFLVLLSKTEMKCAEK